MKSTLQSIESITSATENLLINFEFKMDYKSLEKIGEGTYGVVYKAVDKRTNQAHALKRILLNQDQEGIPSTCIREITILKDLKHANVVRLHDVILNKGKEVYLVFEFVDMDLAHLIKKFENRKIPTDMVQSFMRQLFAALNYCHSLRVLHRDLKPANILVRRDGVVKLADFGLARAVSIPSRCYTHEVVTLWYRPPEILLGSLFYSSGVDIWSLGCIFAEMSRGKALFDGSSEIQQLFKIFERLGTPTPEVWPGVEKLRDYKPLFPKFKRQSIQSLIPDVDNAFAVDLLEKMLVYQPSERITARRAMGHVFIADYTEQLVPLSKYNILL